MFVYVLDINNRPLMPTKRFDKVRRMLRDGKANYKEHTFWSDGYFVCSIGEGASYETIQKYISTQGSLQFLH